jgi:hypothetical protein
MNKRKGKYVEEKGKKREGRDMRGRHVYMMYM